MPEQKRRKEARHAKNAVASGAVDARKPLNPEEAAAMFRAIDAKVSSVFGIRRLVELELDGLHKAPEVVAWTQSISLIDYASWRGASREGVVLALLNAGADPTDGEVPVTNFAYISRSYAVWVARAAARMRQLAAMQTDCNALGECACGLSASLVFSPCSHACCHSCVWKPFRDSNNDRRPILKCPSCSLEYSDPFVDAISPPTRRAGRVLPAGRFEDDWQCKMCAYRNRALWSECRNCGLSRSDVRPPRAAETESVVADAHQFSVCWQEQSVGLVLQLSAVLLPSMLLLRVCQTRLHLTMRSIVCAKLGIGLLGCLLCKIKVTGLTSLLMGAYCLPQNCWRKRAPDSLVCRQRRREESLERWLSLPEARPSHGELRKVKVNKAISRNADADAADWLGITRAQRCIHLQRAAERGDVRRVRAILEAGVQIDVENEYGQSPLFLAAWAGHADVVRELVHWGADAGKRSNGGVVPAAAARAADHGNVLTAIAECSPAESNDRQLRLPQQLSSIICKSGRLTALPELPACEGNAFYVDGAFEKEFLRHLEELWSALPVAGREEDPSKARKDFERSVVVSDRSSQSAAPRRSYFCDVEGWLVAALSDALKSVGAPALSNGSNQESGRAYVHMRFLHYADEGGFLPAHTDLARTDDEGRRSTHTFLLYLSGVEEGGETVLLESLAASSPAVAIVKPVRGRLLVYPHACPHRAAAIVAPPKLLLRGEMR